MGILKQLLRTMNCPEQGGQAFRKAAWCNWRRAEGISLPGIPLVKYEPGYTYAAKYFGKKYAERRYGKQIVHPSEFKS